MYARGEPLVELPKQEIRVSKMLIEITQTNKDCVQVRLGNCVLNKMKLILFICLFIIVGYPGFFFESAL